MTINHTFTVTDPIGLHARPVGQIVTLVRESGATVTLRNSEGKEASAASQNARDEGQEWRIVGTRHRRRR